MDFQLSPDQEALRDAVADFLNDRYAPEGRKAREADPQFAGAFWREACAMGLTGIALDAGLGGLGLSPVEAMIVYQLLGASMVREPFLWADAAQQAMARAGTPEQQRTWLAPVTEGAAVLVLAHREEDAGADLDRVATTATETSGGFALRGRKTLVAGAALAGAFLVSARIDGAGVEGFVVPADAPGVTVTRYTLLDGRDACDLTLDGAVLPASARLGAGAGEAIAYAVDYLVLGLCAELLGAADRAIEVTKTYLKTRHQFGRPIGSFQALQHRMADMLVEYEQSLSIFLRALSVLDGDAAARRSMAGLAKAKVGAAARMVAGQAIQLHGGIGVTEEYVAGQIFKCVVTDDILYGSHQDHYRRYAQALRKNAVSAASAHQRA